ncbi:hypothetical protein [Candidatus Palauibacter sp.]|uniref:hypothetical protein n=1 Tax=Candidatus Palauibacter sp. TaxID=3101350 RepID=UPI003CC5391B
MIRVLADSPHDAALIEAVLRGTAQVVSGFGQFANGDGPVECLIIGCRSRRLGRTTGLLKDLERTMPWVPIILVTDRDPDVARRLRDVRVSDIVWFDDLATGLQPCVHEVVDAGCARIPLLRLATEIEGLALPPAIGSALAYGLRSAISLPVRSVTELAAALRRSPVTLSQEFRESVTSEVDLRLFLGALVILRAHQLRTSGRPWEAVGRRLGFTRTTLHRKSKKWPGSTLKELAETPHGELMARFMSDFERPLLNGPDSRPSLPTLARHERRERLE